jgi:uncharacterized protein YndB with AHSA1/START domain
MGDDMSDHTTAPDRLGSLQQTSTGWELRYVRHLEKPPARAWRAFVDPGLVAKWFPSTIVGELTRGSKLEFEITGMKMDPMFGEVIEVDEPHRLVFTWGEDLLRFDLAAAGGGTELTMTVLLGQLGKGARDGAGWHECLDKLAQVYADDPASVGIETWGDIHPSYVERFGPEASTMGPPQEYLDAQQP